MTQTQDPTSSPAGAQRAARGQRCLRPWLIPSILIVSLTILIAAFSPIGSEATGLDGNAPQSGPQQETWGDVDCSGSINPIDSLKLLRKDAGLSSLSVQGLCPGLGSSVEVDAVTRVWGDGDCSGALNPVDSLKTLRFDAGLSAPKVDPTCPGFGSLVTVGAAAGLTLLNEVLFAPGVGDDPFVELKTTGSGSDPSGLVLVNERDDQFVILNVGAIGGDDVLLLEFGGSDFLDDESGSVELRDGDEVLDRVAWGSDRVDGVRLTPGGFLVEFEPGTSIGRVPGSTGRNPNEWVTYRSGQKTPDAPNADAGVQVALPLDGAIFESGDVKLNWYPVPRATGYRVEVASEETFIDPHIEQTVASSSLQLTSLPAGDYFWRVQVIGDTVASVFSPVQSLKVGGTSPAAIAGEEENVSGVPFIVPHKDTAMLLLEKNAPSGDFAWDKAHSDIDPNDSRNINNAILASVAMVNGFLGGDLSQDRMGYEVFRNRTAGAERDLAYGDAFDEDQGIAVMLLAFQAVDTMCSGDSSEIWDFIIESLEMGLPSIGAISSHAVVVTGSRIVVTQVGEGPLTEERFVSVSDPFAGEYEINFDGQTFQCLWRPAEGTLIGGFDEAEIASDSDGDGIVDFDEVMRFDTDPVHADSDRDGLNDKEDLAQSIFEGGAAQAPGEGYAADFGLVGDWLFPVGSPSRDFDRDGVTKELDCDSDNDGVQDGDDTDNFSEVPTFGVEVPCAGITDILKPRIGDSSYTVAPCTERADFDPDLLQCVVTFSVSMDYDVAVADGSRSISCAGEHRGEFTFNALAGSVSTDVFSLDGVASLSPTGFAYFEESGSPIFSNPLLIECLLHGPPPLFGESLPLDTVKFAITVAPTDLDADSCFPSAHTDCGVP